MAMADKARERDKAQHKQKKENGHLIFIFLFWSINL